MKQFDSLTGFTDGKETITAQPSGTAQDISANLALSFALNSSKPHRLREHIKEFTTNELFVQAASSSKLMSPNE